MQPFKRLYYFPAAYALGLVLGFTIGKIGDASTIPFSTQAFTAEGITKTKEDTAQNSEKMQKSPVLYTDFKPQDWDF